MDLPARLKFQFPWRRGNRFELLVDGHAYFPRMLEAVELARRYVLLEIYLFESGVVASRFIGALASAASRGVVVKVLIDDFGAAKLLDSDRARLTGAGVDLLFYNPVHLRKWFGNMLRDHRKLLIVDGEVAFVSGTGITDEFDDPKKPARSWRETAVRISGPELADWQELFIRVWNRYAAQDLQLSESAPHTEPADMRGRVAIASPLRAQDIRRSLYRRVRDARQCVWLATAYFVPSRKLLRALKQAVEQGADVRLLLPGRHTDHPAIRHAGRRFYSSLLRHGVRIFEYQPRFLHAKTLLCDQWVSIGSSNFDRWNLRWNLEANQEVDDPGFAASVHAMFEADLKVSVEIDKEQWKRRRWITRLREHLWGRVDMWLENLGRRRVK
ncbi:MAG TPA: phospholipase D-like domain-containing protein [Acidiferrobacterales bacterium]|nr:phospholipase D-like domain-containing protein [Acidiferrobacterales bacterium]